MLVKGFITVFGAMVAFWGQEFGVAGLLRRDLELGFRIREVKDKG